MVPTRTESTAVVLAEGGAVGTASVTAELELAGLLVVAFVAPLGSTAIEVLAVVGVLVWATALLVPAGFGVWRRVRGVRTRRASGTGATQRETSQ